MLSSKSKGIWSEKSRVSYNSLIYIINQFYLKTEMDKDKMVNLGMKLGPRIYESLNFQKERSEKRPLKIIDAIKLLANNVWPFLFEKEANSLETFTNDKRKHPYTDKPLVEYVIYDYRPIYLKYSYENTAMCHFYSGVFKGIMNYCGFDCNVTSQIEKPKDKDPVKCAFIFQFEHYILDRDDA